MHAIGADVTSEENKYAGLVMHLVFVAGLFTFAVLLGIVTDDIGSAVEHVRKGNYPVIERNHTVVLGWNRQTIPLLRQVCGNAITLLWIPGLPTQGKVICVVTRNTFTLLIINYTHLVPDLLCTSSGVSVTFVFALCAQAHMLLQIALAQSDSAGTAFGMPVVILADKDKEDMDNLVSQATTRTMHVAYLTNVLPVDLTS